MARESDKLCRKCRQPHKGYRAGGLCEDCVSYGSTFTATPTRGSGRAGRNRGVTPARGSPYSPLTAFIMGHKR